MSFVARESLVKDVAAPTPITNVFLLPVFLKHGTVVVVSTQLKVRGEENVLNMFRAQTKTMFRSATTVKIMTVVYTGVFAAIRVEEHHPQSNLLSL